MCAVPNRTLEVGDTGRRRRWSEDEKLKIVLESLQAPRQLAATARRYGVSRSLLLRWRRSFRAEPKEAVDQTGFVPAMVVAEATPGPIRSADGGRSRSSLRPELGRGSRAPSMRRRKTAVAALADGRLR